MYAIQFWFRIRLKKLEQSKDNYINVNTKRCNNLLDYCNIEINIIISIFDSFKVFYDITILYVRYYFHRLD